MRKSIIIAICFLYQLGWSQDNCELLAEKYIPSSIEESIDYFKCKWTAEELTAYKEDREELVVSELLFDTGLSITNRWKLWSEDTILAQYFIKMGIVEPIDMSKIILTSLHRNLNELPLEIKSQIKNIEENKQELLRKEKEELLKEFNKYQVGDTLKFTFPFSFVSQKQEKKYTRNKCTPYAVILDRSFENRQVKIRLLESCDNKGIFLEDQNTLDSRRSTLKISKKQPHIRMKKDEVRWTPYAIWIPKSQ